MDEIILLERLGLALALGLLIGLERGWQGRQAAEGSRVAGLRTFGLIGLGGGLAAYLTGGGLAAYLTSPGGGLANPSIGATDPIAFGLAFLGFALLMTAAHLIARSRTGDFGATTMVAALVTFLLGALAAIGEMATAAASAVIVTLLLSLKSQLHVWVARIDRGELLAVLKLLLISVVLLPVLPDRGYGPLEALNPYEIWWMVVLIAGISFCGYVGIRLLGPERGVAVTALLGGLASSTAVALSFARLSRRSKGGDSLLAAGIVFASATMLPRMLLVLALLNLALAERLLPTLGLSALVAYAAAGLLWYLGRRQEAQAAEPKGIKVSNPFEFWLALRFGLLLGLVMLLTKALPETFGSQGLYGLALLTGLGDVDALNLTMARLGGGEVELGLAAGVVALAALSNTLAKSAFAWFLGSPGLALRVAAALLAAAATGVAVFLLSLPATPA